MDLNQQAIICGIFFKFLRNFQPQTMSPRSDFDSIESDYTELAQQQPGQWKRRESEGHSVGREKLEKYLENPKE